MKEQENKCYIIGTKLQAKYGTQTFLVASQTPPLLAGRTAEPLADRVSSGEGIKVVDQYGNCQDGYDNTNASTKGNNITVFYGDNCKMFETRSNIQNMLGAEEYTCHFKNQWHHYLKSGKPNERDNKKIFNYLENHPTWNKTTKTFKMALTDYKNSFK